MKETFMGIEKAIKQKRERLENPTVFYQKNFRERRIKKGLCIECGEKKITKSQRKKGLVNCYKCRIKRRS